MPSYFYKAKKDAQHTITGYLDAQNEQEALELIHQLDLIPVSIEERTSEGVIVERIQESRIKPQELYFFSKQLANLIKSGVSLLKALEIISGQSKNVYFSKIMGDISVGVKSGRSLSLCLSDYPVVFSPLYISMVRAGEEMGSLRQMLNSVADYLKSQQEFSSKIRGALVYPTFMLFVGIVTVIFILTFVMPKMAVIFMDTGQKLPLPTVIVMGVSHFLKSFGLPLLILGAIAFFTFNRWRQTDLGSKAVAEFLLSFSLTRNFVLKTDLARFTRTMQLLLQSGLPIVRSIEVAAPTIHNPLLRNDLLVSAQGLTAGENFGHSLSKSTYVPALMAQILTVGEESGSLVESLGDIADSYESDINEITKGNTTILAPLMILAVGSVVGLIVFAMLLPIFSMDLLAR